MGRGLERVFGKRVESEEELNRGKEYLPKVLITETAIVPGHVAPKSHISLWQHKAILLGIESGTMAPSWKKTSCHEAWRSAFIMI